MSVNAETAHRLTDALNSHDAVSIDAVFADDVVFRPAIAVARVEGRAAATKALLAWVDAHETYHIETVREFFAGDEGYYEWRFTATRPTGEPVEIHGVDYFRFADAKIVEKNSFIKE